MPPRTAGAAWPSRLAGTNARAAIEISLFIKTVSSSSCVPASRPTTETKEALLLWIGWRLRRGWVGLPSRRWSPGGHRPSVGRWGCWTGGWSWRGYRLAVPGKPEEYRRHFKRHLVPGVQQWDGFDIQF